MAFTRREFLMLAGGAALPAAAGMCDGKAAQGPRDPRSYYGGFRMAIAARCLGKLPINQLAARVSARGLKYLELSPAQADLTTISTVDLRRLRAQILDVGLSVHDYGVLQLRVKSQRRELEAIFRRAEEFGFESLIIDPAGTAVKELDRFAGRFRVNLAIINRADGYAKADVIGEAVEACSDRVGAAIDTGAFVLAGEDPAGAIVRLKTRVFVVHLTDVTASGNFCPPGRGKVDFAAVFDRLREISYDRLVVLACDGFLEQADVAISESLEYFKKVTGGR